MRIKFYSLLDFVHLSVFWDFSNNKYNIANNFKLIIILNYYYNCFEIFDATCTPYLVHLLSFDSVQFCLKSNFWQFAFLWDERYNFDNICTLSIFWASDILVLSKSYFCIIRCSDVFLSHTWHISALFRRRELDTRRRAIEMAKSERSSPVARRRFIENLFVPNRHVTASRFEEDRQPVASVVAALANESYSILRQ